MININTEPKYLSIKPKMKELFAKQYPEKGELTGIPLPSNYVYIGEFVDSEESDASYYHLLVFHLPPQEMDQIAGDHVERLDMFLRSDYKNPGRNVYYHNVYSKDNDEWDAKICTFLDKHQLQGFKWNNHGPSFTILAIIHRKNESRLVDVFDERYFSNKDVFLKQKEYTLPPNPML